MYKTEALTGKVDITKGFFGLRVNVEVEKITVLEGDIDAPETIYKIKKFYRRSKNKDLATLQSLLAQTEKE